MIIICTMPKTSMTTTPRAIGNGAKMFHVASTSALALESSWPDGCRWCHESGSRRYCRVTWRRYIAPRLYIAMPPASRRPMTPVTVTRTTSAMTPPMVQSCWRRHGARCDGRRDLVLDHPADRPRGHAGHDAVDDAAEDREREPPGLSLDATRDDGQAFSQGRGRHFVHVWGSRWSCVRWLWSSSRGRGAGVHAARSSARHDSPASHGPPTVAPSVRTQ